MKSKYAIVCQHSEEYQPLANLTIYRNKMDYVRRWGYDLHVRKGIHRYKTPGGHAGGLTWDRLDFLRSIVEAKDHEWVWCVGADTLITNLTIPLTKFTDSVPEHVHLVIAADGCAAVQADSFLVRCNSAGIAYLRRLLTFYKRFKLHIWVENQVMINLHPEYAKETLVVPQRVLNAYDYTLYRPITPFMERHQDVNGNDGQWHYGDFLIHWPGMGQPVRLALAEHYYSMKLIVT